MLFFIVPTLFYNVILITSINSFDKVVRGG